jgi:WD40 repeat protein
VAAVAAAGLLGSAGRAGAPAVTRKPDKAAARTDLYGDLLPPGAVARLGTVRFRYAATSIAYSPDGKVLAAGGADNQIRLLDAATGKEVRRLTGHQPRSFNPPRDRKGAFDLLVGSVGKGNVTAVAFSRDGKTLASAGWDETVRLWDVGTGKEQRRLMGHRDGMVAAVTFSPDDKYLASRGGVDGTVVLWDAATGKELHRFDKLTSVNPWRFNRDSPLAFAPDGKTLAAGDRKVIHLWQMPAGKETGRLEGHTSCVSLAYSPDGKLLASGGVDGHDRNSIRIWDVATGKEVRRCKLPKDEPPIDLAFNPDASRLVAVVEEDDLRVFDVASGNPVQRLKQYWPSRIAYAPDGKTLVSVRGQTIRLWDTATGKERFRKVVGHQAAVSSVVYSPDGKLVASGGEDVRLWDAATGKPVRRIATPGATVAFTPDGKTLAAAGRDRIVRLYDVQTGKETSQLKGHRNHVRAVAYSPDGQTLASGDVQATIRLWDVATGKEVHQIDMKSGTEHLSLAFSPDARTLACAGAWNDSSFLPKGGINIQGVEMTAKQGYLVLLWDVATGKEVRRFAGLKDNIKSVAFSPDGRILAAASRDGRIALWEASTGKEVLYIMAHPNPDDAAFSTSPCVAFSPDGKTLVSASTDKTIRLWDVATAKELRQFQAPDGGFHAVAFAPDGKALVSGSSDSTVVVWDPAAHGEAPKSDKNNVIFIGD